MTVRLVLYYDQIMWSRIPFRHEMNYFTRSQKWPPQMLVLHANSQIEVIAQFPPKMSTSSGANKCRNAFQSHRAPSSTSPGLPQAPPLTNGINFRPNVLWSATPLSAIHTLHTTSSYSHTTHPTGFNRFFSQTTKRYATSTHQRQPQPRPISSRT